jgi:phosphatidate cytidylyltransferase
VLRQRALSSVFIVALTLAAAFLGRYIFAALIALAFGLIVHEFDALLRHAGHRPLAGFGYGVLAVLLGAVLIQRWEHWAPALIAATVILPLVAIIFRRDHQGALTDWALTVAAALYVALPAAHFILLRDLPGSLGSFLDRLDEAGSWQSRGAVATALGLGWYLLAQIVTWLSDVGAYAYGRALGRHKLAPLVSPGKSVEGAIGGLVCGGIAAILCVLAFRLPIGLAWAALAGVALSALGQVGDLAESLLKRQAGLKDSGTLIPGHGGIFDRLDSLLVVATATYYLARALT